MFEHLRTHLVNATLKQKMILIGGVTLLLGGIIALFLWNSTPEYRILFSNLEAKDAGEIVNRLKSDNIQYRISDGGSTISVPATQVYETRLTLASRGLPSSGSTVGFELFDKTTLGMSEFLQHINYTRALQGELSRTLSQLESVEKATVHIVRPKPSVFRKDEKPTTASVTLKMVSGKRLNYNQIQGITHLVASAVEGLSPENVTILDTYGEILNGHNQGNSTKKGISHQLESQSELEKYLTNKAQSLLDQVVGPQRALVRVHAQLDFTQSREVHEKYDPDAKVAKEEKTTTREKQRVPSESGGTGTRSKLSQKGSSEEKNQLVEKEEDISTLYAVDKTVQETEREPGKLVRLSVALAVDQGLQTEVDKLEALVKESVGFDSKRGDTMDKVAVPFITPEKSSDDPLFLAREQYHFVISLVKQGVIVGVFLLFFLFLRSAIKSLSTPKTSKPEQKVGDFVSEKDDETSYPDSYAGEGDKEKKKDKEKEIASLLKEFREITHKDFEGTSAILRKWIAEDKE